MVAPGSNSSARLFMVCNSYAPSPSRPTASSRPGIKPHLQDNSNRFYVLRRWVQTQQHPANQQAGDLAGGHYHNAAEAGMKRCCQHTREQQSGNYWCLPGCLNSPCRMLWLVRHNKNIGNTMHTANATGYPIPLRVEAENCADGRFAHYWYKRSSSGRYPVRGLLRSILAPLSRPPPGPAGCMDHGSAQGLLEKTAFTPW